MRRHRPPFIKPRRPVFVGCEGASEVGYVSLLQDLLRADNLPVYLQIEELGPGTGDPLSRIEMAVQRLERLHATRTAPKERFALLDSDQTEQDLNRAQKARALAAKHGITIVWQQPCFEAMLLRHLHGKETHRPPSSLAASRALEREWPEYRKPMTRANLARRLDRAAVLRAARVEDELNYLLRCIGLL